MEFFRLDGEFGVGATGTLKSRGGPEARFRVVEIGEWTYADATDLGGAELVVHHEALLDDSGGSSLTLGAWVEGPDAEALAEEVGDISDALQGDLDALVALLEGL